MELMVITGIKHNLSILTSSDITYFLLQEFNSFIVLQGGKKIAWTDYSEFGFNFIPYLLRNETGHYFDYITIAISSIICTFEHAKPELKRKFIEWIVTVIEVRKVNLFPKYYRNCWIDALTIFISTPSTRLQIRTNRPRFNVNARLALS
jgi:hypothetical protein